MKFSAEAVTLLEPAHPTIWGSGEVLEPAGSVRAGFRFGLETCWNGALASLE